MGIHLEMGDITTFDGDVIVNAANSHLRHGGGVAAAISRVAGPGFQWESDELVRRKGPVPVGGAAITGGHALKAMWVVHAVGPVFGQEDGREAELLRSAYRSSLELARKVRARSIAFPAISAGIFGYPLADAARVAVEAIGDETEIAVTFMLFDRRILKAFEEAADRSGGTVG
ncbi:MAG: macro domain-containing protein [Solirubrobacterales bacterium]|nr:macro domain-containing protein [Solirubrobacterales bacterium]